MASGSGKLSDFDYPLAPELIAQRPARPRDSCRLLVLDRRTGETWHRQFPDLVAELEPDDVVVLNDTRVLPARLRGRKAETGGEVEVLLLREHAPDSWEALVRPARRVRAGTRLLFGEGELQAEVVGITAEGGRRLRFSSRGPVRRALERLGEVPLPPYVHRRIARRADYQTIYARAAGSSAAPTAGLHFTARLLDRIRAGVDAVVPLTLHIGVATFRPIRTERLEDHAMHVEHYVVPEATARAVNSARERGSRIVAVGTTTVRALESAGRDGLVQAGAGATDLYLRPGRRFQVVDAMLTNFHLPRSTLLLLVCAFAGREPVLRAYAEAAARGYRFFSFGDAMFIR